MPASSSFIRRVIKERQLKGIWNVKKYQEKGTSCQSKNRLPAPWLGLFSSGLFSSKRDIAEPEKDAQRHVVSAVPGRPAAVSAEGTGSEGDRQTSVRSETWRQWVVTSSHSLPAQELRGKCNPEEVTLHTEVLTLWNHSQSEKALRGSRGDTPSSYRSCRLSAAHLQRHTALRTAKGGTPQEYQGLLIPLATCVWAVLTTATELWSDSVWLSHLLNKTLWSLTTPANRNTPVHRRFGAVQPLPPCLTRCHTSLQLLP